MVQDRRIAVVTGGSRGIGRNTVLSLAKRGVDSVFTYKSAFAEADAVAKDVEEIGRKAVPLQLDLPVKIIDFCQDEFRARRGAQDKVFSFRFGEQLTQVSGAFGNFDCFHNSNRSPRIY